MQKAMLQFLCCCFFTFLTIASNAQHKVHVTGHFKDVAFTQFVVAVEAATPYHFFYEPNALDSFKVTVNANETVVTELLSTIFANTTFHYAIDANNNIFISSRFPLHTTLPAGFFKKSTEANDSVKSNEFITDFNIANFKSEEKDKLIEIGSRTSGQLRGNVSVAGYVRHAKTGEPIAGVNLFIDTPAIGAITDQYGYYTLTLPRGRHLLKTSGVGMKDVSFRLMVYTEGKLNIEMEDFIPSLKTVIVRSDRNSNTKGLLTGVNQLNIKSIKQVPVLFGETDVLRVVLTLPGVTSAGEASTGFNVRGGSTDQNLILFGEATIYNPAHLFGFFSAFNPDVVKGVELYKSGIPVKYGGRLSSVLDVTIKDGNAKKVSGVGGIGLLTSKLTIEGPLVKDKSTFILGGRTTYSNWLLKKVPNDAYRNSKASFYDINLHLNHAINKKNNIFITGYISDDAFKLNTDTLFQYGNKNFNIKWKHLYNNKLNSVITAGYDHYNYAVSSEQNPVNAYQLSFSIKQSHFRSDFNYVPNNKHHLNFGFQSIYYQLHPGMYQPKGSQSLVQHDVIPREQALESAFYIGDAITVSPKLAINAGLRYSLFQNLGPGSVYRYVKGLPRQPNTAVDTQQYAAGKIIHSYKGPEYRLTARYSLSGHASLKISFNTLRQYIHMLSNTTAISPTDIWKLSDAHIKPQQGHQLSLGYYKNFKSNTIETSVEVYYKKLSNYLDYKSGATLIMNHHIETDVLNTEGKAYGAEILIKKETGKLNGWASYTYARTWLKMDDPLAGEIINKGAYYPANFDKPHNINIISNYRFSHRFSISINTVYNTGRPITIPLAFFNQGGAQRLYYSQRNEYRIPDYFRTDISLTLEGNHKIKKLTHNSWSLGVYNLTGRQNAYSVYFLQQNGVINGYQLSIFGVPIPFITYNFRF